MKALKILALAVLMVVMVVPFAGAQTITWNSSFTVVNLGTADATVDVTFYNEAGASFHPDPLVPGATPLPNPFVQAPGTSTIVVMAFASSDLPDGRYSVVLSADQPIVAIANLAGADGTIVYNGSYSGMEDIGQVSMYMPSVNKAYFDWNSHLSVQNLTGSAMDITIEFYAGTPATVTEKTQNVPAYSSWHYDLSTDPVLPTMFNGSAKVLAAGPVAAVDNQYNQNPAVAGANQVYGGLAEGNDDLYCPALYDNFIGVWISSLNVQNIGSAEAHVTYIYSDGMTETAVIGPNAANLTVYNTGAHAGGTFSAHVQGDQPLVAVANANAGTASQTYECFTGGATEIRTPLVMKQFVGVFNTGVQIQNVGSATTSATITYEGYPSDAYSVSVPANGTYIFYTPGEAFLPAGFSGAAAVTADQPLVGIVNQTNDAPGGNTGDFAMSFDMFLVTP
jgi:hypothetical protein